MIQLFNQDCLEAMQGMKDGEFDLCLTDPPYFLPARHYNTRTVFSRNFSDLGILEHFFKDFFNLLKDKMKSDGTIYLFCDGQSYPLFYYHLYPFCKSIRPLIWDKKTSINGYSWRHQHEIIIFAEMPMAKPVKTGDGDIIKCPAVKVDERLHPAEKPIQLLELLIKKSTSDNSIVFDPFAGSATTAISCLNTKRNFIGYEIDKDYFEAAQDRLKRHQAQLHLTF